MSDPVAEALAMLKESRKNHEAVVKRLDRAIAALEPAQKAQKARKPRAKRRTKAELDELKRLVRIDAEAYPDDGPTKVFNRLKEGGILADTTADLSIVKTVVADVDHAAVKEALAAAAEAADDNVTPVYAD